MASYRPPISRDTYHYLEAYYFRLVMYTMTVEYREDLNSDKKHRIAQELNYINMTLSIMKQLFSVKGGTEKSVVAWEADSEDKIRVVYTFSCIAVAADSLGLNRSKISAVCKGKRPRVGGKWTLNETTGRKEIKGGWHFTYEDEYEDDELQFDPNSNEFKFIDVNGRDVENSD